MNNILSLINPTRIIKVEDARKIAKIQVERTGYAAAHLDTYASEVNRKALRVLQSFESLYALKLEKGHFVCEVEKPKPMPAMMGGTYNEKMKAHSEATAKVIFEGFEEIDKGIVSNGMFTIWFSKKDVWIEYKGTSSFDTHLDNIGDLLHNNERYNRTATTPIELKYTSNILSLLKIEG